MKVSKIRGFVALVLAVGVPVIGLAFQSGAGSLSAFGLDYVAALCPVGALESMLGAKAVSVHGLVCLAITVVVVVFVGKAFCSWACPVPWLQKFLRPGRSRMKGLGESANDDGVLHELESADEGLAPHESQSEANAAGACRIESAAVDDALHELGSTSEGHVPSRSDDEANAASACKLEPLGGQRDGLRLDSRHAVLGGALLSSALFGFPVFCLVCPVGLSFATLAAIWHLFQFNETTWGLIAFPLILVLEVVLLRKWCFNFCPLSALVSLISRANPTFKPTVDSKACLRTKGIDCQTCVNVCPERVDPHSDTIPECSKCHVCVESCPAKAIAIRLLDK